MKVDEFGGKYKIDCIARATQGTTLLGEDMEYKSVDEVLEMQEYMVYDNETSS